MSDLITITEVSRSQRRGFRIVCFRFYEERGRLIQSGARRFGSPAAIRGGSSADRVHRLCPARIGMMTLDEGRAQSLGEATARDRVPEGSDWAAALQRLGLDRIDVAAKLPSSIACGQGLMGCIGCGCLSLDRCELRQTPATASPAATAPPLKLLDRRPAPLDLTLTNRYRPAQRNARDRKMRSVSFAFSKTSRD